MIWHVSIKLRSSKGCIVCYESVFGGGVFFDWLFGVFSFPLTTFSHLCNVVHFTCLTAIWGWKDFAEVLRDIRKEPYCWDSASFCSESDSNSSGSFAGVSTFLIWFTVASLVSRGLSEIDVKYPGLLTPPLEWSWIFGLKEEMTLSNTTIWQRRRTLISPNC